MTDILGNPLSMSDIFFGFYPGSWGETSTLCILIGAAILLVTGIANWRIMLSGVLGAVVMSVIANTWASPLYPASYLSPIEQICLGGFMFAIVFMATDPVTASHTNVGKYIYGALIGVMAILIRVYNPGFPEGAMLAVLLMNCFAPLIDHCVVSVNIKRRMNRLKVKNQ